MTKVSRAAAIICVMAALPACSKKSASPDQVLVRGDDFEITLQEYDQLLQQSPAVTKDAVAPMRRAVLEGLIGEKLMADEASKAELEKQPATAHALAAARRAILAQAYIQRLTGTSYKPSAADVQQYYDSHPERFGKRRRFVINEFVIRSDLPNTSQYAQALDKGGLAAVAAALKPVLPDARPATVTRFSDEMPDTADGLLTRLGDGDSIVYQTPGQFHLGQVQSVGEEPISLEAAQPRIEASLSEERRGKIVRSAIEQARQARHIEVVNTNLKKVLNDNVREVTDR